MLMRSTRRHRRELSPQVGLAVTLCVKARDAGAARQGRGTDGEAVGPEGIPLGFRGSRTPPGGDRRPGFRVQRRRGAHWLVHSTSTCEDRRVPKHDRLTALDTGFLHLERSGAHMHVAAIFVFDGGPPAYDELVEAIEARMHLVPRYRQKLAHVPLGQGRPVWVDDPHFNVRYHLRHSALPPPGSDEQLKNLAGRLFALPLDRTKPLWEINLVEGLDGGRFAIISKTHHALVDGVSGVDVTSVIFDTSPEPSPVGGEAREWLPRPEPTDAELLADALLERATVPAEAARGLRALTRAPRHALERAGEWLVGMGAMAWAGLSPAPATPFNVPIGPHRRYTWVDADLAQFKAIKNELGGTLNDVVLAAVALALGRFLRRRGEGTDRVGPPAR